MGAVVKEIDDHDGGEKEVKPVLEEFAIYLSTDEEVPIVVAPRSMIHIPMKMEVPDLTRSAMYFMEGTPGMADFGVAVEQAVMHGAMLDEFEIRICNPGTSTVYLPSRLCVAHVHRMVYNPCWDKDQGPPNVNSISKEKTIDGEFPPAEAYDPHIKEDVKAYLRGVGYKDFK